MVQRPRARRGRRKGLRALRLRIAVWYSDGYDAGLRDAQGRRQFDPISEGRYRSGDHGYEKSYGSRDAYKVQYRDGFRSGYEEGYGDARRY